MPSQRQVRADFDDRGIVVYQAYAPAIAEPALAAQRFLPPFSLNRMTWIKPSFLWLMHRSGWATKPGQERILAVRITRAGWQEVLAAAALTAYDPAAHASPDAWRAALARSPARVQWDPERSLRGQLAYDSIQVGIGRPLARAYAQDWVLDIRDLTALARKLATLVAAGRDAQAKRLLPPARPYPLDSAVARRLGATA